MLVNNKYGTLLRVLVYSTTTYNSRALHCRIYLFIYLSIYLFIYLCFRLFKDDLRIQNHTASIEGSVTNIGLKIMWEKAASPNLRYLSAFSWILSRKSKRNFTQDSYSTWNSNDRLRIKRQFLSQTAVCKTLYKLSNWRKSCLNSGFRRDVNEIFALLGCYAVSIGN